MQHKFYFFTLFIFVFMLGVSMQLFLWSWRAGATLVAQAPDGSGFSCQNDKFKFQVSATWALEHNLGVV